MNNQKGYTLTLVLIIISVILLLGVTISTATLNSRKQFNGTDSNNQATDLAEMGITHYNYVINSLINFAEAENSEKSQFINTNIFQNTSNLNGNDLDRIIASANINFDQDFCNEFATIYNKNNINVNVDDGKNYQIIPTGMDVCSDPNKVTLHFDSIGTTSSPADSVKIHGTFNITPLTSNNDGATGSDSLSDLDIGIITQLSALGENLSDLNLLNLISIVLKLGLNLNLTALNTELNHLLSINLVDDNKTNGNSSPFLNNVEIQNLSINGGSPLVVKGYAIVDNLTDNGNPPKQIKLLTTSDLYLNNLVKNGIKPLNVCVMGNIYLLQNGKKSAPLGKDNSYNINNICRQEQYSISSKDGIELDYSN